ncbi:MAG: pepA [Oscillospiraceae bacterium]|jgi:endoglucanase|nr:pepA [Oscillospiraceae bacterium]
MLLEELCLLNGISGDEREVRDFIISQIKGFCDYSVDALGNLIAHKKGKKTASKKLMLCAHMDEVGFIVTSIKSDGSIKFAPVGGVDSAVCLGREVFIGKNKLPGVIGGKAVHNLSDDEKKKFPEISSLYIDIGASSKEEAEKFVALGDSICFKSDFISFGSGMLKGKAIDDRAGCAMLIELIKEEWEYDTFFVFTVQEEIGTRGAKTASNIVKPDFAIVLETTTASDIPGAEDEKRVCELGKGAVVSYMDRSTIYDKELYKLAFEIAREKNIPVQTKTMVAGGNDSGAIHVSGSGVRTVAISVPCRYLHSPSCVVKESDILACKELARNLSAAIFKL